MMMVKTTNKANNLCTHRSDEIFITILTMTADQLGPHIQQRSNTYVNIQSLVAALWNKANCVDLCNVHGSFFLNVGMDYGPK
jgi:glucosamine 6-phosphate synthetase-like amidotransferase/phosphosugar isomerase protein